MKEQAKELDYQGRVKEEKTQLEIKIFNLQKFLEKSPIVQELPREEQQDLHQQLVIMEKYREVLSRRINRFNFDS